MRIETTRRIKTSFEQQGMMQTLGAQIDDIAAGEVCLSAAIAPLMSQQHGAVHAGATFALGDSASGYAALTLMDPEAEVMTVEMKINLLAPAVGDRIVAIGRVAKAGKRLIVTQCEVMVEAENSKPKVVAILQGTMIPVTPAET